MSTDVFLYFNGDSFVEGCELGDFLIPEYPGPCNFTDPENSETKKWYNAVHTMGTELWHNRNKLLTSIKQEEKNRNFSSKLAQLLNVNFLNNALGGSGMDRIIRTTISDLNQLKKTEKNIVAIIGTAEPMRIELPVTDDFPWRTFHPGNKVDNEMLNMVLNYYYMNSSNYHKMFWFYTHVLLLQDFCKLNGIKLLWVSGNSPIVKDYPIEDKFLNEKDIEQLVEYVNFKPAVDMKELAKNINRGVILPGYHYSEIVHCETAKKLYEQL